MRQIIACLLAFFGVFALRADARGECGTCLRGSPQSYVQPYLDAKAVAVVQFRNAVEPNNALPDGQVEIVFLDVLKPHPSLPRKKSLVVPVYCRADDAKYVVAFDPAADGFKPTSATALDAKGDFAPFLRGLLQLKEKSKIARARYMIDYLNSPCWEVAQSAHAEVLTANHQELRQIAATVKPEFCAKALRDNTTRREYLNTYARLLGYCGKQEDAILLRKLLDDCKLNGKEATPHHLFSYMLLEPSAGWEYAGRLAEDRQAHFMARYAALRAMRELRANCPEQCDAQKAAAGVARFLVCPDMADFAIEDLRRWERWEYFGKVHSLLAIEGYDVPIMRRSVLRFALQCPTPGARAFVKQERARDAEWVAETEELLALEIEDLKGPKK